MTSILQEGVKKFPSESIGFFLSNTKIFTKSLIDELTEGLKDFYRELFKVEDEVLSEVDDPAMDHYHKRDPDHDQAKLLLKTPAEVADPGEVADPAEVTAFDYKGSIEQALTGYDVVIGDPMPFADSKKSLGFFYHKNQLTKIWKKIGKKKHKDL